MSRHSTSIRMSDALQRFRQAWKRNLIEDAQNRPPLPAAPPRWTIAISREAGVDVDAVTRLLGERLGWPVYDRELIDQIAADSGLRTELVESLDETSALRVRKFIGGLIQMRNVEVDRYLEGLLHVVTALAAHGDCVIVGRGAAELLPLERTLAIRLVAPLATRVAWARAAGAQSDAEARREVERVDSKRRDFIRRYFQADPADPSHYDLVLNVARLTPTQCVSLIGAAFDQVRTSERDAQSASLREPAKTAARLG